MDLIGHDSLVKIQTAASKAQTLASYISNNRVKEELKSLSEKATFFHLLIEHNTVLNSRF